VKNRIGTLLIFHIVKSTENLTCLALSLQINAKFTLGALQSLAGVPI
jgi:hypothetical protein